jgi:hypothetical protein
MNHEFASTDVDDQEEADTWDDQPLPLVPQLDAPAPFPMNALPKVLAQVAHVVQRTTQAPDAIIGGSLLAGASLAAQAHANVRLPHGQVCPLSLFIVSVAESGERKSAVDNLVLRPHVFFEKRKKDEYEAATAAIKALPKDKHGEAETPRQPIFMTGDPTIEGVTKLLTHGLPSIGLFSAEGGRFIGGYGMSDDAALRTAAGLSMLWDGSPLDRVRSGDGASKLYHRRVAMHLMAQPRATFNWLGNPVLRDQGLFSRCLVGYPASTAGSRLYRDERADETPEYEAYVSAMSGLLDCEWATNEFGELQPIIMEFSDEARARWIEAYNQIERQIPERLACVRGFASKAAEHLARIAAVLELVRNPDATEVTKVALDKALLILDWYMSEAVRLAGAQPVKEGAERAELLWGWLKKNGKKYVCLAQLTQYGPARLRQAKTMREVMGVLADHYYVRPIQREMEWQGKMRREIWEVRL